MFNHQNLPVPNLQSIHESIPPHVVNNTIADGFTFSGSIIEFFIYCLLAIFLPFLISVARKTNRLETAKYCLLAGLVPFGFITIVLSPVFWYHAWLQALAGPSKFYNLQTQTDDTINIRDHDDK